MAFDNRFNPFDVTQDLYVGPVPIVAERAPTTADSRNIELGTVWIDKTNNDAYFLTSVVLGGDATWINAGGGSGSFSAITVNPGNLTVTAGNFEVSAGSVTLGAFGHGILQSDASGVISSTTGTNGQILIMGTGVAPAAALPTCDDGSITIVPGSNSLIFRATGATASTFVTDVAGPVSPLAGATTITGGTNISTDGTVANTITLELTDDIIAAASLTATNDLFMLAGTCTVTSDDNAAQAIYLHTDAGTLETIDIHADQGTDAASIYVHSDVGGLTFASGLASADALNFSASDAAGGMDFDYGTNGASFVGANGAFTVESGTAAVNIGTDAVAHTVTVGSTTGAASTVIQSGTGDTLITSTGDVLVDATSLLEFNSSGGVMSFGNDAVAQNMNFGTGAAARVLTFGNTSGASSFIVDCGTGGVSIGESATDHSTTIGGTTGVSALTLQAGTGATTITAGGIFDVNAVGDVTIDTAGVVELNSTAAAIGIGNDADAFGVNIATGAAARDVVIGNITGATSFTLNVGTGDCLLATSATDHTTTLGSTTGVSALTLQAGTGATTVTAGGVFDINATGDVTLDVSAGIFDLSTSGAITVDSSGGTIGVGVDDIDQAINIGTAGERAIGIGNATGATAVTLTAGSTNGIVFASSGNIKLTPATDTQAAAAVTINAKVGVATFTGLTTAAAGTQDLTITNSEISEGSGVIVTVSNLGANDAQMIATRTLTAAGSVVVTVRNDGAASLNGNIILSFIVLN